MGSSKDSSEPGDYWCPLHGLHDFCHDSRTWRLYCVKCGRDPIALNVVGLIEQRAVLREGRKRAPHGTPDPLAEHYARVRAEAYRSGRDDGWGACHVHLRDVVRVLDSDCFDDEWDVSEVATRVREHIEEVEAHAHKRGFMSGKREASLYIETCRDILEDKGWMVSTSLRGDLEALPRSKEVNDALALCDFDFDEFKAIARADGYADAKREFAKAVEEARASARRDALAEAVKVIEKARRAWEHVSMAMDEALTAIAVCEDLKIDVERLAGPEVLLKLQAPTCQDTGYPCNQACTDTCAKTGWDLEEL